MVVFAILRSSVWGFVVPRNPPTINGNEFTPLGFSPVPFMVLTGLAVLGAFVVWEQRRARLGRDQLLDTTMLRIAQLRAGLSTLLGQQLVLMGTFFVIPVYLQVVLGFDAFETGKRLLPTVGVDARSSRCWGRGSPAAARRAPSRRPGSSRSASGPS